MNSDIAGPAVGTITFTSRDGLWSAALSVGGAVTVWQGNKIVCEASVPNDEFAPAHVWTMIRTLRAAHEGE